MTKLIVGVDGGGSKTVALVADRSGAVLGRASAATSNYHNVGAERALAALDVVICNALAAAGADETALGAACLGLAGVDRPADRALFDSWAARRWPGLPVTICNDAELVLAAGTPDGHGLALICGTGTIALGRRADGRRGRSSGWGYVLDDEGSGYAIGVAGLRAVVRASDGRGPATALTAALLAAWQITEVAALLPLVYQTPHPTAAIAALSTAVAQAAEAGDAVAQHIMAATYAELAQSLVATARQLELGGPVPCAVAGGVALHTAALIPAVIAATAKLGLHLAPVTAVAEPALGALRLAQQLLASQDDTLPTDR